ncbi:MAG: hypothetical protein JW778_05840 [Candidatus Altiarchaeota archaeon]|nr:hypothetical protein [Candidatus Altiarchaeota archaeon]
MGFMKNAFIVFLAFTLVFDILLIAAINMINSTLLNPDFIVRELDRLGFYSMIQDHFAESAGSPEFADVIRKSIPESWIRENFKRVLCNTFNYLNSETASLNATISLIEVKEKLLAELPASSINLGPVKIELDEQIPDSIDLSEGINSSGLLTQLKAFIGYLRLFYSILILAAFVIVSLIVVISKDLRKISLTLSSALLASGLLAYCAPMIASILLFNRIKGMDLPAFLPADSLITMLDEGMQPMRDQGVLLFSAGIILFASFILLKTHEARREIKKEEETEQLLLEEVCGETGEDDFDEM